MAASAARSRHGPARKTGWSWQTAAHSTLRPLRCSMNSEGRIHDLQTTAYHGTRRTVPDRVPDRRRGDGDRAFGDAADRPFLRREPVCLVVAHLSHDDRAGPGLFCRRLLGRPGETYRTFIDHCARRPVDALDPVDD